MGRQTTDDTARTAVWARHTVCNRKIDGRESQWRFREDHGGVFHIESNPYRSG